MDHESGFVQPRPKPGLETGVSRCGMSCHVGQEGVPGRSWTCNLLIRSAKKNAKTLDYMGFLGFLTLRNDLNRSKKREVDFPWFFIWTVAKNTRWFSSDFLSDAQYAFFLGGGSVPSEIFWTVVKNVKWVFTDFYLNRRQKTRSGFLLTFYLMP